MELDEICLIIFERFFQGQMINIGANQSSRNLQRSRAGTSQLTKSGTLLRVLKAILGAWDTLSCHRLHGVLENGPLKKVMLLARNLHL